MPMLGRPLSMLKKCSQRKRLQRKALRLLMQGLRWLRKKWLKHLREMWPTHQRKQQYSTILSPSMPTVDTSKTSGMMPLGITPSRQKW